MTRAAKSSPPSRRLPAAILFLLLEFAASSAHAQQRSTRAADSTVAAPFGVGDLVEAAVPAAFAARRDTTGASTVAEGTRGRVTAREGGWVRVQLEGWMRADQLREAGPVAGGFSAAELRASPEKYVGQEVEWRLQLVSVQAADALRPEMPPGQPYLLTRGPLPEPGFVYVMVRDAEVERFRAMPPLAELTLKVTIRAARTRYLTTPVAELVTIVSGATP